jgi:drug/metabolite transporter (DMT)-like permease
MDVTVGILLALATAVAWGSREILLRKAFEATRPVQGLFVTMAATFLIALIAAFFYESAFWNRLTATDVLLWSMIGVLHFPLAMTLYYQGIDSVGGSRTSVVSNISAIVTPFLGMGLLSEPSSLNVIAGVCAAGVGVFMVSDLRRRQKLIAGSFLSGLGQVTLFAALALAPTVFVVPTYNLKSLVTVILAYAIIPKSEKVNMRVILGALLAIGGIVLINI